MTTDSLRLLLTKATSESSIEMNLPAARQTLRVMEAMYDALKSCEYEIGACLREISVRGDSAVLSALQTAYDEARRAIAKAEGKS